MILRELNKACLAFKVQDNISTGKWGCGAFNGNVILKFLLQWIAFSAKERSEGSLIFNTYNDAEIFEQLNFLKGILSDRPIGQILL